MADNKLKLTVVLCLLFIIIVGQTAGLKAFSSGKDLEKRGEEKVSKAAREFSFELFHQLAREEQGSNLFFSPRSLFTILTMVYNGAEGKTKAVMDRQLGLEELSITEINRSQLKLTKQLQQNNQGVKLNTANSIWLDEGFKIKQDFKESMQQYYQSKAEVLDFSDPDSAAEINNWIADKTKGQIRDMITSLQGTELLLVNAVYFKGDWKQKFNHEKTAKADFKQPGGGVGQVLMMEQQGEFNYYEGEECKVLELPYHKSKLAMYVLLPNEEVSLNSFADKLDKDMLDKYQAQLAAEEVKVRLPKFNLKYGKKRLNNILKEMGLGIIFSGKADFSKIASKVFVGAVDHKAVIEVDEEGSEAAGASETKMPTARPPSAVPSFTANRPFLFLIEDKETKSILFMGQLVKPEVK